MPLRRKFAIGDIHGNIEKLEDLLAKIRPKEKDTLIFLGDYIDRGDSSKEVVEALLQLARRCNCVFLRGNHEQLFLEYLEHGTGKDMWIDNGGRQTIKSYTGDTRALPGKKLVSSIPPEHMDFFTHLRWYFEDDDYIYVHAGVMPSIEMHRQDCFDFIWIRGDFINNPTGLKKKVIFGHTPQFEPVIMPDIIGIDTGAGHGRYLTAVKLPEETFIHSFV